MVSTLTRNLAVVRDRIAGAAERANRDPAAVQLVAVTKSVEAPVVGALREAGARICGENRVQAARGKIPACPPDLEWHLIGHLQSNKARKAVELFRCIHSVDSTGLIAGLGEQAAKAGKVVDCFLEVNVSGEGSKDGVPPEALPELVAATRSVSHLRWLGLMTMAPLADDPEAARPFFRRLRKLRDMYAAGETGSALSMGMTQDYVVAVEEGATHVRIGRALFEGVHAQTHH
ncbi:MAG: YggS family pyridoxal phosphate-dependent enzyme [Planctomycetes bacterium]|nr:YggS family pyridoxal phosphate-dependent enzyme [Planctomycetota bacterium]